MALYGDRGPIYVENERPRRRRVVAILLGVVLAYLLLADIAPRIGFDLTSNVLTMLGVQRAPTNSASVGQEGPAGSDGLNGLNGSDGRDGLDGLNGATGASGPQGEPGVAGADGADGADGVALNQNQGAIGFGSCDSNVVISLSSQIDPTTATFTVSTIHFSDVNAECFGQNLRVYLFSGSSGSYVLEATSDAVRIPSSSSFELDTETLNIGHVESSSLSKLAFEISG